ncbi:MAG: hypothetical protein IKS83_01255 [Victivallales bacterium]|nr:hypothetical protein [Victivallales bacterium]
MKKILALFLVVLTAGMLRAATELDVNSYFTMDGVRNMKILIDSSTKGLTLKMGIDAKFTNKTAEARTEPCEIRLINVNFEIYLKNTTTGKSLLIGKGETKDSLEIPVDGRVESFTLIIGEEGVKQDNNETVLPTDKYKVLEKLFNVFCGPTEEREKYQLVLKGTFGLEFLTVNGATIQEVGKQYGFTWTLVPDVNSEILLKALNSRL